MRLLRIFLLFFNVAKSSKAENFVYFLMAFINPITSLIYWNGAYQDSSLSSLGWSLPEIATYYLLVITGGSMLMAHVEYAVAYEDIYQGNLSQQLTRPFSYPLTKLLSELPWRLMQGSFGMLLLFFYAVVFHRPISLVSDQIQIFLAVIIAGLAFLLSFFLKMILGLTALWTTDFSGMQEVFEVTTFVFAGFVLPLSLFPDSLQSFMLNQPFAYIIYLPMMAFIGKLPVTQMTQVIGMQVLWIGIFWIFFQYLWYRGVKKFTGVGN